MAGEIVDREVPVPIVEVPDSTPFLLFEVVPALGVSSDIYRLLLATGRPIPMSDGSVRNQIVAVAQLQGNREALLNLRQAIDNALLLGTKPEGQAN